MTHRRPSRKATSSANFATDSASIFNLKPGTRIVRHAVFAMAATMIVTGLLPQTVHAADVVAHAGKKSYNIAAGPLSPALSTFAGGAGVTLSSDSALTEGLRTQGLQGSYTVSEGFARLLSGSGLEAISRGQNIYTLSKLPAVGTTAQAGETTLPLITATAAVTPTTEGSGSYTTRALTIGKITQSIRETPQSVSVVTRQQMDDKNLTTLDQVMEQATGITKTQRNFGDHKFAMRGFVVDNDNYLIDGVAGSMYSSTGWLPVDMAVFDRVEVLRGAGGLIVGPADPSGAVNLVRKRPRAEKHFNVNASVGSWNNYRTEVDAGGALNAEGSVRGRVVAAYQDRQYFYDVTQSKEPLLYGVVEVDLGRDTTLMFGARHQENTTDGFWLFGLPRFTDGRALNNPRSASLVQDWNRQKSKVTEVFTELEHRLNGDWKAKLSANRTEGNLDQKVAIPRGAVDPVTLTGSNFYNIYFKETEVVSTSLDANISGSFQALGGTHQILIGSNWSRQRVNDNSVGVGDGTLIDVFNPNHTSIAEPARPAWESNDNSRNERYGIYASARLQLAEPLHLLLGGRLSWLKYQASDLINGTKLSDYKQDHEFTPYGGLVYDLNKQWSVYTSYADTFQPQSSFLTASRAPLKPAIGANYEIGVKGELYDGRLNVSAAVFSVKKTGLAVVDAANLGNCPASLASSDCYRNGSKLRSKGFELEATGEVLPGWQIAAGYTHVTSSDDEGKTISAETPRHLLRASTNYRLPGELNAWTVGGGVSAQSSYSYFADDDPSVLMGAPGRAVWDARASYRINRTWTASLNVANLFDKTYYSMLGQLRRGNYYGEPRNVTLTLRGTF